MDKHKHRKLLLFSLLSISLIGILILAISLPSLQFSPGRPLNLIAWFLAELASESQSGLPEIRAISPRTTFLPQIGDVLLQSLIVVFWLLVIISVIFFFVSPKFRRELARAVTLLIFLVIFLPQIAKNMTQQTASDGEQLAPGYALGEAAFPQPPAYVQAPPEWLVWVINGFLFLLIFFIILYLWRRFRPKPDAQAVVVTQVRRALSEIETGSALKDVIIACYAQMCQELQESQRISRHKAMTPREFEKHLSNAGIASIHIQQLTRLFEDVRYGAQPTDQTQENQAKLCLQSILEVYGD